jgi:hypothetical protein
MNECRGLSCLVVFLLAGCATADWTSRIGNLTYEQAVTELGPPIMTMTMSDGTRRADWLVHRGSSGSVGSGRSAAIATKGMPASPSQYLLLTFGSDGRLMTWKQLYR